MQQEVYTAILALNSAEQNYSWVDTEGEWRVFLHNAYASTDRAARHATMYLRSVTGSNQTDFAVLTSKDIDKAYERVLYAKYIRSDPWRIAETVRQSAQEILAKRELSFPSMYCVWIEDNTLFLAHGTSFSNGIYIEARTRKGKLGKASMYQSCDTDEKLAELLDEARADLKTPRQITKLQERTLRATQLRERRRLAKIAKAKYLLVRFNENWADEFDLRGGWVATQADYRAWCASVQTCRYPAECYFGTNESIEYTNYDSVMRACVAQPITKTQYNVLSGLFPGTFGMVVLPDPDAEGDES
jgi:hypothetical protein